MKFKCMYLYQVFKTQSVQAIKEFVPLNQISTNCMVLNTFDSTISF